MSDGITYAGDYRTTDGPTPGDAVQIFCSDPNFLEQSAAKKPNAIVQFFQGAYSYPRDWWVGILWCMMALGTFGGESKRRADAWGRDLETLLRFGINNPELASRLIGTYLHHQTQNSPAFYGRIAGGVFTGYASRGGRFGNGVLSFGTKAASTSANFILATTGAMILAVKYGGRDIVSIMDAAITGDYGPDLSNAQYKELFRAVVESNVPVPQAEQDALVQILQGVLDCISNPGKYGSGASRSSDATPHVPVGQVSSMRPNGLMGSIPAGSETNALDVIGDQNNLLKW